jgi:hypothetical protein
MNKKLEDISNIGLILHQTKYKRKILDIIKVKNKL